MKTDALIRTLVTDLPTPVPRVGRRLAVALGIGFVVALLMFQVTLGPRPDFPWIMASVRFDMKYVVMGLLFLGALWLAQRLVRPGSPVGRPFAALLVAPVVLLAAVAVEMAVLPEAVWGRTMIGMNSMVCLRSIPFLSIPLLIAALYALRAGAPTSPALAGAVAGLLSSGLAAVLYATHCTDDSPLFVVVWYTLAIAIVTAVGAVAGRFVLRW